MNWMESVNFICISIEYPTSNIRFESKDTSTAKQAYRISPFIFVVSHLTDTKTIYKWTTFELCCVAGVGWPNITITAHKFFRLSVQCSVYATLPNVQRLWRLLFTCVCVSVTPQEHYIYENKCFLSIPLCTQNLKRQ